MQGPVSPRASDRPDAVRTIIIVEDDAAVRSAIKFALEVEGFAVDAFEDGEDVLKHLPLKACSCLVIDYWLPKLNGLALLHRLRAAGIEAPALIITTNPAALLRARIASAGARIIEKPLAGDALVDAVRLATRPA